MDLWNAKDLKPPPVTTCNVTCKDIEIRLLKITLTDALKFFENQQHLLTEAALLSRTVYRLKMKFRSSKDFKAIEKLSRVLRTYLQMNFSKSLEYVLQQIPKNYQVNKRFPLTKNMLDFLLVRLQGLGKTLCRVLETCKVISELTLQRFRLGHFWKIAAIIYAITARIFVISKNIFKFVCELYLNLLPFSSSLNNAGGQWLPDGYVFPPRLDQWLELDWLNLEDNVIEIPDDEPDSSFFKFLGDSDDEVEFCDEYVLVGDDSTIQDSDIEMCESQDTKDILLFDQSHEPNMEDLVIVCDNTKVKKPKRNKWEITDTNLNSNEEIDVGELVIVCDNTENAMKNRKRKRLNDRRNFKGNLGHNKHKEVQHHARKKPKKKSQNKQR